MLQIAIATFALGFGVACLRVAAVARERDPWQAAGWGLTGAAFTLSGLTSVLQTTWAALAFWAGAGSAVYAGYLSAAPVGNHARGLLIVTFGCVLLALLFRRREPTSRFWIGAGLALAVGAGAGGALGWREGGMSYGSHFSVVAALNTASLWILLAALLRSLFARALDRLLWGSLVCYALYQALGVVWSTAVVMWGVPGAWSPSPRMLYLLALASYAAMIGFALRRLALANRGAEVPNFAGEPSEPSILKF